MISGFSPFFAKSLLKYRESPVTSFPIHVGRSSCSLALDNSTSAMTNPWSFPEKISTSKKWDWWGTRYRVFRMVSPKHKSKSSVASFSGISFYHSKRVSPVALDFPLIVKNAPVSVFRIRTVRAGSNDKYPWTMLFELVWCCKHSSRLETKNLRSISITCFL